MQVITQSGISTLIFFRLLPRAPLICNLPFRIYSDPCRWNLDAPPALTGTGRSVSGFMNDGLGRAFRNDAPTVYAGTGPKVDHMIGSHDGFFIMFDHHDGIAKVA